MAKIENGRVVLTLDEQSQLRRNLINPPENIERDRFMKKIEDLVLRKTKEGFSIETNIEIPVANGEE